MLRVYVRVCIDIKQTIHTQLFYIKQQWWDFYSNVNIHVKTHTFIHKQVTGNIYTYCMSGEGANFVFITDVPKYCRLVIREGDNVWDALDEVNAMGGAEMEDNWQAEHIS